MSSLDKTKSSLQHQLLIRRDCYRKQFAISAVSGAVTALAIILFEMRIGALGGLLLGGAGVSLASAIYHHKMRAREIKEFGLPDDATTRWRSPIAIWWEKIAVTKT